MNSIISDLTQSIGQEAEHARRLDLKFIQTSCLFEMHFQKRYSTLLEICPELEGLTLSESNVAEIKRALKQFIQDNPSHGNVIAAADSLAKTGDDGLKELFVSNLRLNLAWGNSSIVCSMLRALEDLGEDVFYTEDGTFIGSRSSNDWVTNFAVAKRYLESQQKNRLC